jgi:hypothetical protein
VHPSLGRDHPFKDGASTIIVCGEIALPLSVMLGDDTVELGVTGTN